MWNILNMFKKRQFPGLNEINFPTSDPELQKRNRERCKYIDEVMDPLLNTDPDEYLRNISRRIMQAGEDIFGTSSDAVEFLRFVQSGGTRDPATFSYEFVPSNTSSVAKDEAPHLCLMMAYELLWIYRGDLDYFKEDGFYSFWFLLEDAGMSHEDIGRYYERFDSISHSL